MNLTISPGDDKLENKAVQIPTPPTFESMYDVYKVEIESKKVKFYAR